MSARLEALLPAVDRETLNRYGVGIPFTFGALGVLLLYRAAPGIASFGAQNGYAKLGIVVIAGAGIACLLSAGYTYRALDSSRWLRRFREEEVDE